MLWTNSKVTFSNGTPYMDVPELTCKTSMLTFDVVWKSFLERWMTGTDGERESDKSVIAAQIDDPIYPNPPLEQDMTQGQFF